MSKLYLPATIKCGHLTSEVIQCNFTMSYK